MSLRSLSATLASAALVLSACGSPSAEPLPSTASSAASAGPSSSGSAPAPSSSSEKKVSAGEGRFTQSYLEPATEGGQRMKRLLEKSTAVTDFLELMNNSFSLPRDVTVVMQSCGEANAHYDPETHEIALCYELLEDEHSRLREISESDAEADDRVLESTAGTLYHEAGHALIGELDLKFTGREEDVADQFAAYILGDSPETREYLVTVSDTYKLSAEHAATLDDLPFYDTHGLDAQRSVTFLCYTYGIDPEQFDYLVSDDALPKERAEGCAEEYQDLTDGWDALLEPHMK